ncbi:caspase family protein [bacterium]|nr:caspase family protein [bacterium]
MRKLVRICIIVAFSCFSACGSSRAANADGYALLVGAKDYPSASGWQQLRGPNNDVQDVQKFLTDLGYDSTHIQTLTNAEPTRDAIIAAFRKQLIDNASAHPNGLFVFYYSGHGSQRYVRPADGQNASGESDTSDETIVPVDSDSNSRRDIIDNEIAQLSEELCNKTKNVLFIFDCCNSGSPSRGERLGAVRQAEGYEQNQPLTTKSQSVLKRAFAVNQLNRVQISACMDGESARESQDQRPNGILTSELLRIMRSAGPTTTWGDVQSLLISSVQRQSPEQHPIVQADYQRKVFDLPNQRVRNSFQIQEVNRTKATINAGSLQGLYTGSTIALYSQGRNAQSTPNAIATIASSTPLNATFVVPKGLDCNQVKTMAVRCINPNFSTRFGVYFATKQNDQAASELHKLMTADNLIKRVPTQSAADFTLVFCTFKQYCADYGGQRLDTEACCDEQEGYFIQPRSGRPLFNAFIINHDPHEAAVILYEHIYNQCRQINLLSMKNGVSGAQLENGVKVELVDDSGKPKTVINKMTEEIPAVHLGDWIKFRITNNTDKKLYVSLFSVNPNGSVDRVYLPNASEAINPHGQFITNTPGRGVLVAEPCGLTILKAIITTDFVPLDFVGQSAGTVRGGKSPKVARSLDAASKSYLAATLAQGLGYSATRADGPTPQISSFATQNIRFLIKPAVIESAKNSTPAVGE